VIVTAFMPLGAEAEDVILSQGDQLVCRKTSYASDESGQEEVLKPGAPC